jgi:hypothetical protein
MPAPISSIPDSERSYRSRQTLEFLLEPAFEQLLMTLRSLRSRILRMRAFAQSLRDC